MSFHLQVMNWGPKGDFIAAQYFHVEACIPHLHQAVEAFEQYLRCISTGVDYPQRWLKYKPDMNYARFTVRIIDSQGRVYVLRQYLKGKAQRREWIHQRSHVIAGGIVTRCYKNNPSSVNWRTLMEVVRATKPAPLL